MTIAIISFQLPVFLIDIPFASLCISAIQEPTWLLCTEAARLRKLTGRFGVKEKMTPVWSRMNLIPTCPMGQGAFVKESDL